MFHPIECDRCPSGIDGIDGLGRKLKEAVRKVTKATAKVWTAPVKRVTRFLKSPKRYLENVAQDPSQIVTGSTGNYVEEGLYGSGTQRRYQHFGESMSRVMEPVLNGMTGGASGMLQNAFLPGQTLIPEQQGGSSFPDWVLPVGGGILLLLLLNKK